MCVIAVSVRFQVSNWNFRCSRALDGKISKKETIFSCRLMLFTALLLWFRSHKVTKKQQFFSARTDKWSLLMPFFPSNTWLTRCSSRISCVEFLIGQVEWYKIKERSSWFLDALCVDWAERLSAQQNSRREEDDHLESVKEPRDGLIRITTG